MRVGICSDFHLDFYARNNTNDRIIDSICDQAKEVDLLIFAGDLYNGHQRQSPMKYRQQLANAAPHFVEVKGNHDYYFESDWMEPARLVDVEGYRIGLATLWSDCHDEWIVEQWFKSSMADAEYIEGFSIAQMKYQFGEHKRFLLESNLDIVVTHNPPSLQSVGEKYANADVSNRAFMPEIGNEIADTNIKLWVCGHVHHKHSYMINNTQVVCNPLGYPSETYRNPLDYKIEVIEVSL